MIKKIIAVCVILLVFVLPITVFAETEEQPSVTAAAYVLYNPDNNEIVESKNANISLYPASLTKMMTALCVIDLCDDLDNEKITVSENAVQSLYGTGSSKANIKIGEIFTARQLLYLMLLPSGNDAANALADHFTAKGKNFIEAMNNKATALGMNNTNFANPHGLHNANHYTTAADLAVLADAYMSDELLYSIAQCNEYTVPQTNLQLERKVRTTNFLRIPQSGYYYEYATGLKTGNTDKAGRCLAASAEKDGKRFICILLDTPEVWGRNGVIRTDFQETAEIFKYAFKTYECVKVANKGQMLKTLPVFETNGKTVDLGLLNDVYATLPKDANLSDVKIDFTPKNLIDGGFVASPVSEGTSFGQATIMLDNKVLGSCEVVSLSSVKPNGLLVFWHKIDFYVYLTAAIIGFLFFVIVLLIVRKKFVIYKRKKAKEKREKRRKQMQEVFLKQDPIDYFKMNE